MANHVQAAASGTLTKNHRWNSCPEGPYQTSMCSSHGFIRAAYGRSRTGMTEKGQVNRLDTGAYPMIRFSEQTIASHCHFHSIKNKLCGKITTPPPPLKKSPINSKLPSNITRYKIHTDRLQPMSMLGKFNPQHIRDRMGRNMLWDVTRTSVCITPRTSLSSLLFWRGATGLLFPVTGPQLTRQLFHPRNLCAGEFAKKQQLSIRHITLRCASQRFFRPPDEIHDK